MPTLSVLLPTLNCMPLLPAHLSSMRPWLDLADEIIVIDSHSTDGTLDLIRSELASFPLRIELHPRGLYQSWNHGIRLARGDWLYISTVGDSISRELLQHLLRLGTASGCDVAVSRPDRIDANDQPLPPPQWAVTEIIDSLAPRSPCTLTGAAALYYSVRHHKSSALIGSSASNLYRTSFLQPRPFPVDYGTAGDAAWCMLHAFDARFAFTPARGSTFRIHEKAYNLDDYRVDGLCEKLLQLGLATASANAGDDSVRSLQIPQTYANEIESRLRYGELKTFRKRSRPWFFYPKGWRLRSACHKACAACRELQEKSLAFIRDHLCQTLQLPP